MSHTAITAGRSDQPVFGVVSLLLAVLVFSFQDVVVKAFSDAYAMWEIVFVRSVVSLPIIAALALARRGATLATAVPGLHLLRGVLCFTCFTLYYLGLAHMPLVDAAVLFYTAPLFITLLSVPLLGERVGVHRTVAVALGFAGVVVMLQPGGGVARVAGLLPLLAAATYALSAIVTRRLGRSESTGAIAFYTALVFAAGSLAGSVSIAAIAGDGGGPAFLTRAWMLPAPRDFALMAALGVIAAFGHFGIAHAYRVAPASTVAPFDYSYVVWAAVLGYLVWGEVPTPATVVGVVLVVAGGLYVLSREHRLRRRSRMPVTAKASTLR